MTPESTAPEIRCTVPDCSKAYKRKTGLTNHMASVHQMLVTNVLSPMTETARTLFGKQVVPGTPGVQGNSRGQVTSPLIVAEATIQCGECGDEFENEEQVNNHKKEEHDEADTAEDNDDDGNELHVEEEFLGDSDDEKDLYDALDVLTQSVVEPEKEIEMKDKLLRYRNIMTNKTKLQEKTGRELKATKDEVIKIREVESKQFQELEKKGKDIEKLTKEVKHLKKQTIDLKQESKHKDLIITQLKEAVTEESEIEVVEQHVNHSCNACNKMFRTSDDLEKHIESKHNENTCVYCDRIFNGERALTSHHKRCVDEGLGKSKCNNCKKTFTNFAMRRHREKCHEEQKFDCPECGQMYNTAIDVKRHYDAEHKMEPERSKEVCKHWRRGHCFKGDQCNFAHVGHQQSREERTTREKSIRVPACKHGSKCDWLKRGVCSYFHVGVGVQKPWEERQPSSPAGGGVQNSRHKAGEHNRSQQPKPLRCPRGPRCIQLSRGSCDYGGVFFHLRQQEKEQEISQEGRRKETQLCWEDANCKRQSCKFTHLSLQDFPNLPQPGRLMRTQRN